MGTPKAPESAETAANTPIPGITHADCYAAPRYWDLAFSDETRPEADFLEAVAFETLGIQSGDVLESGCGGGRQVMELSRRGWNVTGIDLEPACVQHVRQRLLRRRHSTARGRASVLLADMSNFRLNQQFDLAHCLVNTFRHLTSDALALGHLRCIAKALRPGGLYVLGLHLLPPDALEYDCERWSIRHGATRITTTIRVLDFNRRTRLEVVRFSLKVTSSRGVQRFRTDHTLRIYRADQIRRLLRQVPEFTLLGVYDFAYDLRRPLPLDDQLGDTVLVLQRSGARGI
jgi:SAM-dependent methyltransferase